MMNLKKTIAAMSAAVLLTAGTASVASAGGLFDLIKSVGNTVVSTVKTVGNAAIGAGKYVFTDKDGEECFADAKKSANEIGDGFKQIGDGAVKTFEDLRDFNDGMNKMITGAIATGGAAVVETVANVVTGNNDYSWTESASNMVKDGYDKYDAGWETVADIATLTGPVGAVAVNGMRVVKKAAEATVGYKDRSWKDVGKAVEDGVINSAIAVATGGIGSLATSANSVTSGVVTSMATKATLKTVVDLADPDNERGVVDTILQDVTNTVVTNSVVGVIK